MKRQIEKQLRHFHKGMAVLSNTAPFGMFIYALIKVLLIALLACNILIIVKHPTVIDVVVTLINLWIVGFAFYAIFVKPCDHYLVKTEEFYGDRALHIGARSRWCCSKCGLVKYSQNLNKPDT